MKEEENTNLKENIELILEEVKIMEYQNTANQYIIKIARTNDESIYIRINDITELPPRSYQKFITINDLICIDKCYTKYQEDIQRLYDDICETIKTGEIKISEFDTYIILVINNKENIEANIKLKMKITKINKDENNEILCGIINKMKKEINILKSEVLESKKLKEIVVELAKENKENKKQINLLKYQFFKNYTTSKNNDKNEEDLNKNFTIKTNELNQEENEENNEMNNQFPEIQDKQEINDLLNSLNNPDTEKKNDGHLMPNIYHNRKSSNNMKSKKDFNISYLKMSQTMSRFHTKKKLDIELNDLNKFNDKFGTTFTGCEENIYLYQRGIDDEGFKIFCKINFENLVKLELPSNFISDISCLENANFYKLLTLNLSGNNITDISVLEKVKFKYLEVLYIGKNKISNISIFNAPILKNLKELSIYKNSINLNAERNKIIIANLRKRIPKLYI